MSYWYNNIYPENQYFYDHNRYHYNSYEGEKFCNCHKRQTKTQPNTQNHLKSGQWYCCKEEDLKKYSDYHFQTPCGTYYKIKPMKYTANRDAVTQCNFPILTFSVLNQGQEKKKKKHQNKLLKRNKTCPQLRYESKSFLMLDSSTNRLKIEQKQSTGCDCSLQTPNTILKSKSSSQNNCFATKSRPVTANFKQQSLEGNLKGSSSISRIFISRGSSRLDYNSCGSLNWEDNDIKMLKPPDLGQVSRSTVTEIHSEDTEMEMEDFKCSNVKSCHLLERIRNAYRKRYKKE